MTDDIDVNLYDERVGPFVMGRAFVIPAAVAERLGGEATSGTVLWLEIREGVTVQLEVTEARGGGDLACRPADARVDAFPGVLLHGRPMSTVSWREFSAELRSRGTWTILCHDATRVLNRGGILELWGDQIEIAWLTDNGRPTGPHMIDVSAPDVVRQIMECAAGDT